MNNYVIADVVPHSGPMVLLDKVEHWDAEQLQASLLIRPGLPFANQEGIPAWVGIEYMAQAVGAYAGIMSRERGEPVKIGFLVGSRRYECNCSNFPLGSLLTVSIREEMQGDNGLSVFHCRITGQTADDDHSTIEASANLNVFQPDNVEEFLQGTKL